METLVPNAPDCSKATIVFLKVGAALLFAIRSISFLPSAKAYCIAGIKCSGLMASKGTVSNGVENSANKGFPTSSAGRIVLFEVLADEVSTISVCFFTELQEKRIKETSNNIQE